MYQLIGMMIELEIYNQQVLRCTNDCWLIVIRCLQ